MKKIILLGFILCVFILLFDSCHKPEILNPDGFDDLLRQHEIINIRRTEVALRPAGSIIFRIRLNQNHYEIEELINIRESVLQYLQSDAFLTFIYNHSFLEIDKVEVTIYINNRRNERVLTVGILYEHRMARMNHSR